MEELSTLLKQLLRIMITRFESERISKIQKIIKIVLHNMKAKFLFNLYAILHTNSKSSIPILIRIKFNFSN
jgi:hypothetical protein